MESLQPLSYGVITVFFILSSLTVLARLYVRGIAMRSFGLDDWCMTFTAIFGAIQQGILYFFLHYGAGLHYTDVARDHPEWLLTITKGLLAEEFFYVWMQFWVKMCFLLFYFRLSQTRTFRLGLWSIITFHATTTIAIWFIYGLQCIPLAAFWDPISHPDVKCLGTNITYFIPYSLNLATDIFVLILPLPVIWSLQMTVRRRVAVSAVLTTGGSAVIVSALRMIVLLQFARSTDFTWTLGKMVIISNIEMQVAVIAANLPALKAFYSCWRDGRLGPGMGIPSNHSGSYPTSQSRSTHQTGSKNNEIELSAGGMRSKARITTKAQGGANMSVLTTTESEEKLFVDKYGRSISDKIRVDHEIRMED